MSGFAHMVVSGILLNKNKIVEHKDGYMYLENTIAVSAKYKNKQGKNKKHSDKFNFVLAGKKKVDFFNKYTTQGDTIILAGSPKVITRDDNISEWNLLVEYFNIKKVKNNKVDVDDYDSVMSGCRIHTVMDLYKVFEYSFQDALTYVSNHNNNINNDADDENDDENDGKKE